MSLKYKIILVVGLIASAYAVGRYLQPAKVVTKTETKVVEVEVEKVKVEYRTIIRTITKKDGTIIKEEIKEEINEKEEIVKKEEEKKELKLVENLKPQWRAQVAAELVDFQPTNYRVGVERRIMGPFFAGAWSETNFHSYGVSISMEF